MSSNNQYLKIINLATVDSTNDYAFKLAEKGAEEITVVRANKQERGKGRRGKNWSSSPGGIYTSLILHPDNPLEEITFLPFIFSLAVARLLNKEVKASLKWPNDVLINGSKIAGVLLETRGNSKKVDFVIVGIGININTKADQIPLGSTSLYLETKKTYCLDRLFEGLLAQTIKLYSQFKKGNIKTLIKEAEKLKELVNSR